jgi:preprotein translocase subunit YajC
MLSTFNLLAETAADGPPPPNALMQFFPFIIIFVLFYFLLIRPQKKRQQQMAAQMAALKTGDKVITAGGIHGLVTNVKDKSATLKIADNVKVEFEKTSIVTVINKDGGPPVATAEKPPLEGASDAS